VTEERWGRRVRKSRQKEVRWRLRRTRAYLWNFNRFLPGNPCQQRDLERKWLLMRIDLSTMPRAAIGSS
jgi:hypothetical protein